MIHVNFISESGKIAVVYKPCEEITDAKTEELQDIIQVCGEKAQGLHSQYSHNSNNQQSLEDWHTQSALSSIGNVEL